uniref:MD-2-related lipid-recognition domain-containing protein n=1 Tax=Trichuris muris TaxID=70415 RepID=A0A5S6R0J1_TRIMR
MCANRISSINQQNNDDLEGALMHSTRLLVVALLCILNLSRGARKREPRITTCGSKDHMGFNLLAVNVTNEKGHTTYPINLNQRTIINLVIDNLGDRIDSISSRAQMSRKVSIMGYKTTVPIPVGSLIKQKVDECKLCPIQAGINVLPIVINIKKYELLKKIPLSGEYVLNIQIEDGKNENKLLFCGEVELEIA